MKILILEMKQIDDKIVFLPPFAGVRQREVVINLPEWANKIVITRNEGMEAKVYAIYATEGKE